MRQSVRSLLQTPRVFSASPRGLALDPRRWPRTEWPSAGVAEWQTQGTQNPPGVTSCGFESHLRHHHEGLRRPPNRPTSRRLSAPPAGGRKPSTRPLRAGRGRPFEALDNGQKPLLSVSASPGSGIPHVGLRRPPPSPPHDATCRHQRVAVRQPIPSPAWLTTGFRPPWQRPHIAADGTCDSHLRHQASFSTVRRDQSLSRRSQNPGRPARDRSRVPARPVVRRSGVRRRSGWPIRDHGGLHNGT